MKTVRIPKYETLALSISAAIALLASAPGHAQLGANVGVADAANSVVVHHSQDGLANYRETTDTNGIVVRQYVDASGSVYAVAWTGPAMPNVEALLGTYFPRFQRGANAAVGEAGLHTARVADGDLVVENHVRLREFSGRAWLVSALPAGVSASDIQ